MSTRDRGFATEMRMWGLTYRQIGIALGRPRGTIHKWVNPDKADKYQKSASSKRKARYHRDAHYRKKLLSDQKEKYHSDPEHRGRVLDRNSNYQKTNRPKMRQIAKRWRDANPEKKAEHSLKWNQANREKTREYARRRRAKGGGQYKYNGIRRSDVIRLLVIRDGIHCNECGDLLDRNDLHVDHIKPVARAEELGLTDKQLNHIDNLQLLHPICNIIKGANYSEVS